MAFKKGQSGNPAGRKKGTPNKITKDIKSCYMEVFDALGGAEGLLKWAKQNPDVFYGQMAKMLPKGVEIKTENELVINITTQIPEPLPLPPEYAQRSIEE
jgi:hypothetical protein